MSASRRCLFYQCGLVPYETAWAWQRTLVVERREHFDLDDAFILLEHPPVYTLGQGASLEFLKFDAAQAAPTLLRTERGGEVTYHCPGQLVGYPILHLSEHREDLHWYLRQLEQVLIEAVAALGVTAGRVDGKTGIWSGGAKLASIGACFDSFHSAANRSGAARTSV